MLCIAATNEPYAQSNAQFKAAFDNHGSSQSFVMFTVTDERSGLSKIGCETPATLVHAIEIEKDLAPVYSVTGPSAAIALAAPEHWFSFKKKAALRALGFRRFEENNAEACKIIRSGRPAYRQDRTGRTTEGQP